MLCRKECPKGTTCKPVSNVVDDTGTTFVCIGYHDELKKEHTQDKFRHCFRSLETDSVFDYDLYDLKSVIAVMSEALLVEEVMS